MVNLLTWLRQMFWVPSGQENPEFTPEQEVKRLYPKAQCYLETKPNPHSQYCCYCVYLDGYYTRFCCGPNKRDAWRYALDKLQ